MTSYILWSLNEAILYHKNCLNEKFRIVWIHSLWGRSIAVLACWISNIPPCGKQNKVKTQHARFKVHHKVLFVFIYISILFFASSILIYFIFQLHWGIIDIQNCNRVKVYKMVTWYTHTLWKDFHRRVHEHICHLEYLRFCVCVGTQVILLENVNCTIQCYQLQSHVIH